MNLRSALFSALILMCAITGCKKDPATTHPHSENPTITDVYTAGYVEVNSKPVAAYWKNGTVTMLGGASTSNATGIAVVGSDIYVIGMRNTTKGVAVATYWKNGVPAYLNDTTSTSAANAIAVSGTDVYITGFVAASNNHIVTTYWKNGVINIIGDNTVYSGGRAIAVQSSDVYVAGSVDDGHGFYATYWKNGVAVTVPTVKTGYLSQLFGISVNSNDVYLAGQVYGVVATGASPVLVSTSWKNGAATILTDGTTASIADAIAIQGSDVYVSGYITPAGGKTIAGYWKNGTFTALGDGTANTDAPAIAIQGSDVYVAGNNSAGNATYWKNGTAVQLSSSSSAAFAIALVSK
jgi:hypothetical protein